MRAFIVTISLTRAYRAACFAALFIGLIASLPAFADDQEKDRMHNALSARQSFSADSAGSPDRAALAGTELISDGGFEVGSAPSGSSAFTNVSSSWTWLYSGTGGTSNPRYYNSASSAARTGNWAVYFDFGPSTNRLSQTVAIPAGVTAAFSFWLKVGTFETSSSVYDTLKASVTDLSGAVQPVSLTYSNLDASSGYSYFKHSLDVSAFAGKTVRIQFDLSADSTGNTIFLLDDVSVLTSAAADSTALFISDQPGDNRFKVKVSWNTSQSGGLSGNGNPIPLASLGVQRGGLFWFFGADNPEVIVKVLNGCAVNGSYWVFYVAGTNVGMTTTVTDTKTGRVKTYHNPDLTLAAPVQDTNAFTCP